MSQTPERRMYLYWRSLRHNREYWRESHKGYAPKPLMMVARKFQRPVREVRDIIDAQKGGI